MTILVLAESIKMMNKPDWARPWRSLTTYFFRKLWNIGTWNFDPIFIQVFNLYYQNLGLTALIVWKLCAFQQRSKFSNFQQFLHYKFRLKEKSWIMTVSSGRFSSDLSEYIIFHLKLFFKFIKINFQVEKKEEIFIYISFSKYFQSSVIL